MLQQQQQQLHIQQQILQQREQQMMQQAGVPAGSSFSVQVPTTLHPSLCILV
jgi:hypothetical protein